MKHRRNVLRLGVAIPTAQFLAFLQGCGGGGGGDDEHVVQNDTTKPTVDPIDKSTFLIVYKHSSINGGLEEVTPVATGFAINDKFIATNAHVTLAIMESAVELYPDHQITHVSAYQAATGEEYPLVLAVTHPAFTGSNSPDAGFFQTTRSLADHLTLAGKAEYDSVKRGDEIAVHGFPGELYPGFTEATIPVATLFKGSIQALRMFDDRIAATSTTWEIVDVSAQLTGGTSGSAIVRNNQVVALNNSGPEYLALTPLPNGGVGTVRVASGANNFGVHVKFLHQLLELHEKGGMLPRDHQVLPPDRREVAANVTSLTYAGTTTTTETLQIRVGRDGTYAGTSSRGANVTLTGQYYTPAQLGTPNATTGRLLFTDNVTAVPAQQIYPRLYSIDFNPATLAFGGNGVIREQRAANVAAATVGTWTASRA